MEITAESPLLPWLVRQYDVAGGKRTAPDLVLWSDTLVGLLEPAHARAHAYEFPKLLRLLRASQSR